jgi:hypothetical protein
MPTERYVRPRGSDPTQPHPLNRTHAIDTTETGGGGLWLDRYPATDWYDCVANR